MIYPFECDKCNHEEEFFRPSSEAHLPAVCSKCNTVMRRIWGGSGVSVKDTDTWNPGLGCRQGQVKEKLKVLSEDREVVTRDSEGRMTKHIVKGVDLQETGNEKVRTKKKHNNYKLSSQDKNEIRNILNA